MLSIEYARISNELGTGLGLFGACTPYDTTKQNYGALNAPGGLYFVPAEYGAGMTPPGQTSFALSTAGVGSGLWVKYVLYKSTVNPAVVPGPAPVYWADASFTTVTGAFSEGVVPNNATSAAGWLLPNSGSVTGMGAGTTAFTATILNQAGNTGSWVWIALAGFIPSCYINTGSTNGMALCASGNFAVTGVNDGTAPTHRPIGYSVSAPSATIGNVLAVCPVF